MSNHSNIEKNRKPRSLLRGYFICLVAFVIWLCLYPNLRMHLTGGNGVGRPVIKSDPRTFAYPICSSNTHPGWGIYRAAGSYTYTLSKPNGTQEQMRGPTPWMQYPELKSLYCEEGK